MINIKETTNMDNKPIEKHLHYMLELKDVSYNYSPEIQEAIDYAIDVMFETLEVPS